jgi:hypothetical protein
MGRDVSNGAIKMRMTMSFAIAAMLTLVAVGTWAATTRSHQQPGTAEASMNPFAMMADAKDLPAPQYGQPF